MQFSLPSFVAVAATAIVLGPAPARAADAPPDCSGAEYRHFDFWVGTWTVTEAGKPAGRNEIMRDLNGCALFESWTSSGGNRGRSFNFYDRNRGRWHQTWIDDRGGSLDLDGGLVQGSMVLEQERIDAKTQQRIRHRITWTPRSDGSVRQRWEMQKDASKGWETVFDGLYRRAH